MLVSCLLSQKCPIPGDEDSESKVSNKFWHRFTYTLIITYNTLVVLMRGWVWMIMVTTFSVHLQKGIFFLTRTFHVWENAGFHSMRYNLPTSKESFNWIMAHSFQVFCFHFFPLLYSTDQWTKGLSTLITHTNVTFHIWRGGNVLADSSE